ncbi:MAG: hypothetical protein ACI8ZM_001776 [Crocinitomix sp.]|jgi:hypothetical protein
MKSLFFFCLNLFCFVSFAQEPQFLWAERLGDDALTSDNSRAVEYDSDGNIYSAGHFSGTVDFDPSAGETLITSIFGRDAYLQKLDADGSLIWVKIFGGAQAQEIVDMDIDLFGNITLMGNFRGTVDFDPGPDEAFLSPNGATDMFIVSVDSDGNYRWSKNIGCKSHDYSGGIENDSEGNILATLSFRDTIQLSLLDDTVEFIPAGWFDMAILKFNLDGGIIWAKSIGGTDQKAIRDITVDFSGNIFLTGVFKGVIDVDPSAAEYNLTSAGLNDFFLLKLNADGIFLWAHRTGGILEQVSNRCITDGYGNLYLIGNFQYIIDFDPGPDVALMSSNGFMDCFIQKFNADGELIWVKQIGGTYSDDILAIDIDSYKNVYITGAFISEVDFDPGDEAFIMTSNVQSDIFIQKMNQYGEFIWAKKIGGPYLNKGTDIRVDNFDNIYLTGEFFDTTDFNPSPAIAILGSSSGSDRDIFVAKFSQCASSSYHTATNCKSYTWDVNDSTYMVGGIYTALLTNSMGCDSVLTLDLTIDTINTDLIVEAYTITVATDLGTYQWIDCDNDFEPILGETDSSYTAILSGNYAVIIDNGTCTDTSECVELLVTIGLNKVNSETKMIVYPNPFDSFTTIYFPESHNQNYNLSIFDILGAEVYKNTNLKENQLQIKQEELGPGVYMAILTESTSGKLLSTTKLVVK